MFKKSKLSGALAFVLSACLAAACFAGCSDASETSGKGESMSVSDGANTASAETASKKNMNEMRDMTTADIVKDMGLGINLGNTFESSGIRVSSVQEYETAWGSPVITKEMIQGYKDAGFDSLRIPVAWSNMMQARTYEISSEYIDRVKEVVEWALDSDLYVIMNIHWDGGWFSDFADDSQRERCFKKYETIWTQLSAEFGEYGDKLIFESLNEEGGWEDIWNRYTGQGDKEKSFGILNDINQKFVDIVRGSGGNNEKRHLLIAGYNTDIELTCDELYKMPDDPAGRCAVSVHYYVPSTFAILTKDADWGKARSDWGTEADIAELNKYMDMMKTNYVDKGIPVIIGEYGCPDEKENKDIESVRKYVSSVCEAAYTRGMCPMLWDITDHFYNRNEAKFRDEELLKEIMAVKEK